MYGNITARGGSARNLSTSGGGSGGSIMVVSNILKGNGTIDASGGDGSEENSGGGAGGRISIRFRKSQNKTMYPMITNDWNGTVVSSGGQGFNTGGNGSEGSLFTTKCQAGYSGEFCRPWEIGWYKSDYSYLPWSPCKNKPNDKSEYDKIASDKEKCSYKWIDGYDESEINPKWLSPFELFIDNLGGWRVVVIILIAATIIIFAIVCFLTQNAHKSSEIKLISDKELKNNLLESLDTDYKNKKKILEHTKFAEIDLLYHIGRIYLVGNNGPSNSWSIPRFPPFKVSNFINRRKFIDFTKLMFVPAHWKSKEVGLLVFLAILFPPFGYMYYNCCKYIVTKRLRARFVLALTQDIWNSLDEQIATDYERTKTIKLTYSSDNWLAYVDFLDLSRDRDSYTGPELPLSFMWSGTGSYLYPYNINI